MVISPLCPLLVGFMYPKKSPIAHLHYITSHDINCEYRNGLYHFRSCCSHLPQGPHCWHRCGQKHAVWQHVYRRCWGKKRYESSCWSVHRRVFFAQDSHPIHFVHAIPMKPALGSRPLDPNASNPPHGRETWEYLTAEKPSSYPSHGGIPYMERIGCRWLMSPHWSPFYIILSQNRWGMEEILQELIGGCFVPLLAFKMLKKPSIHMVFPKNGGFLPKS